MPNTQIDDEAFLQGIEDKVRLSSNIFKKEDVIRLHDLAGHPIINPEDSFDLEYYRLPKDFVLPLIREARNIAQVNKLIDEKDCRVVKRKGHLSLVSTK